MAWKRIGIALKAGSSGVGDELARRLVAVLRERGIEPSLDRQAAASTGAGPGLSVEALAGECELILVLGGDGSVLAAARAVGERPTPLLGVNLGRLGFLTDLRPDEAVGALGEVLAGNLRIEERARLAVTCRRARQPERTELVLNDAVITKRSPLARLIELEARVDGSLVANYRSDGLIVATPTGSTAYNLSAGGPILAPSAEAMILNPICPHTLTQRPLVLPDYLVVEVQMRVEEATLTLDGQVDLELANGDSLEIRRSAHPVRFVVLPGHDFFGTLRAKLHWGSLQV